MDNFPVSQVLIAADSGSDDVYNQSSTTCKFMSDTESEINDAVTCSTEVTAGWIQSYPTCVSAVESSDIHDRISEDSMDNLSYAQSNSNNTSVSSRRKTSKKDYTSGRKFSESADKQSDEYKLRRERNNKFVRACREKARRRHKEVENHVAELLVENKQLSQRVEALTNELTVYKNLFSSVGASIPPEVEAALARSVKQDK